MADQTPIEWTDATWNIITGCSVVSPGCTNCYAMKLAGTRLHHHPSRKGLTIDSKAGPVWNGQVRFNAEWLTQPLRWTRPRMIFVCAHGDLFHEAVPDDWLDQIFAVMALADHHTFQVLTKRPERMREYLSEGGGRIADTIIRMRRERGDPDMVLVPLAHVRPGAVWWPLPNVWVGVSVEDQARADERIPILLDTPAAVRWISAEPLLGPVKLPRVDFHCDLCGGTGVLARWPKGQCHECAGRGSIPAISTDPKFGGPLTPMRSIDWVVAGGESGTGSRPMHPDWARQLRDQCAEAGVPFLFKQWGEWLDVEQARDVIGDDDPRISDGQLRRCGKAPLAVADGVTLVRCGKKAAGRLLDGQLHDGFPTTAGARG